MGRPADGNRVLAIGLDAASVPLIDDMIAEGRLPNLERLRSSSARWKIDGGAACPRNLQWVQFAFGRRVEQDRSELFSFDPDGYRCFLPDARRFLDDGSRQFWDRPDVKALVFEVPESALVDRYVAITGWGGHAPRAPRASFPAGLIDELDRVVGVHRGLGNDYDPAWYDRQSIRSLSDALVEGAGIRARALSHLLRRFPDWELAIAIVSELHSGGHMWMYGVDPASPLQAVPVAGFAGAAMRRVYEAVDTAIGEMVSEAPEGTAVVLFSHDDMRAGHADCPSMILLPELLQRMHDGTGLLRRIDSDAWKAAGCPPVVPRPGAAWRDHVDGQLLDPPVRSRVKGHPLYRRMRTTRLGRWALSRVKGGPVGPQGNPIGREVTDGALHVDDRRGADTNDVLFTMHYQPYWSQARAFALPGFTAGAVRVNLRGREREGIVSIDDYEAVCDEVEEAVRSCRNPRTGNPVVRSVRRPRADDPMDPAGDTADLVFEWADELIDAFEHPAHGLIGPVPAHRPGVHGRDGFLYVQAPGVESGDRGTRPAWDIPATLLALVGAQRAEESEGCSVLDEPAPTART